MIADKQSEQTRLVPIWAVCRRLSLYGNSIATIVITIHKNDFSPHTQRIYFFEKWQNICAFASDCLAQEAQKGIENEECTQLPIL